MLRPSKEKTKRAKFAAEDLFDHVERLFELEASHWEDNGLIRETRKEIRRLLNYYNTGVTECETPTFHPSNESPDCIDESLSPKSSTEPTA